MVRPIRLQRLIEAVEDKTLRGRLTEALTLCCGRSAGILGPV